MEPASIKFWRSFQRNLEELTAAIGEACENPNSQEKKQMVFGCLNNTLHSLLDYWERIKRDEGLSVDVKKQMRAFAYATNKLKHDSHLVAIEVRKGGLSFPMSFSLRIERMRYEWADLAYIPRESAKQEEDFRQYCRFLMQKEILHSFKEISLLLAPKAPENE